MKVYKICRTSDGLYFAGHDYSKNARFTKTGKTWSRLNDVKAAMECHKVDLIPGCAIIEYEIVKNCTLIPTEDYTQIRWNHKQRVYAIKN